MLRIIVQRDGEVVADRTFESLLVTIGRDKSNDLVLDDPLVAPRHLVVKSNPARGDYLLIDESKSGTLVGGKPVQRLAFDQPLVAISSHFEFTFMPSSPVVAPRRAGRLAATTERSHKTPPLAAAAGPRAEAELRYASAAGVEKSLVFAESAMVGRARECDIALSGRDISRRHCLVFRSGSRFQIRRLSRLNMVTVNDRELGEEESTTLRDGDVIRVSSEEIRFFHPATQQQTPRIEAPMHAASPNLDLNVERRETAERSIAALDIIGFLGVKTFPKFEASVMPLLEQSPRVILDLGYLVGIDSHGVQSLGRIINEADRLRIGLQLVRITPRVSDILAESPLNKLLQPFIARSEESAIQRLRA